MLEYQFGFLCAHNSNVPSSTNERWSAIERGWTKYLIGDFSLWTDPLLPVMRRENETCQVVILGDVFTFDGRPTSDVVDELLGANPWPVLDRLGGRFAVLIILGSQCQVAHDAFGSRSVFYLADDRFAIASHAALLARAYGIGRAGDVARFMERREFKKRTVKYLPGNRTVYRQMYALVPNNYLDSTGNELRRYWPVRAKRSSTIDDFHAEVDRYFSAFVPFIASRYKPIFGITGGVDSRAVYCAFRRLGVAFRGVTWRAGYLRPVEEPVVREIVARLKIDHTYLDPKDYPSKKVGAAAGENSGNFRGTSRLTEAMAAQYGNDATAVFVRGYGGEIMRGFYNLRQAAMQNLEKESLVAAYGSSLKIESPSKAYETECGAIFEEFRERANYKDLMRFGYDPNDIFYWEHRMGMWGSAMLNEMDPAVYSLVGFNSRQLFSTSFGLSAGYRLTKKRLKEVVSRNDEVLGAIPYK